MCLNKKSTDRLCGIMCLLLHVCCTTGITVYLIVELHITNQTHNITKMVYLFYFLFQVLFYVTLHVKY